MAFQRRKRDTTARRMPKAALVAAPIALLATVSTVTLGIIASDADTSDSFSAQSSISDITRDRADNVVSRSSSRRAAEADAQQARKELRERQARKAARQAREDARQAREDARQARVAARQARAATQRAINAADTRLWTTVTLNLWTTALASADQTGLIDDGKKVLVTGREAAGRDEIVIDGRARWVTAGYLSAEKPAPPVAAVAASCTNGTSVSSGVSPNIVEVHEAVCAAFPEITTYGTFRSDGEHSQGLAVDIMVSGARGYEVAEFVRAHASALGVNYAIYSQRIWSVDRGGEGWRSMSDRGSSTANHYDHVHVTTY